MIIPIGANIAGRSFLDQNSTLDMRAVETQLAETTRFSGKVLVAEDVEGNQKLMNLMLSNLGLKVTIAEDGNQAVQKALSESFDLILMDIQMPHMNGYEATAALKGQGYKTPIVAVTANAMKGDDQKCIDAGCDGYLAKPIDRRELRRVMARYLTPMPDVSDQENDEAVLRSTDSTPDPSGESSVPTLRDIIDWNLLIDRLGDEEIVREIMPIYIEDTRKHYEELCQVVKLGECEAIASHGHALKGVGRNLGVEQLADLAYQIERAGRDNDAETCTLVFGSLSTEIEKVLTVLAACDWADKTKAL